MPHAKVGSALRKIKATDAWPTTKLAFEFLTLTATRSGEVRLATWDEIDLDNAIWTVPAERMKAGRAHRVPLPNRAVALLREALEFSGATEWVFPSPSGRAHQRTNSQASSFGPTDRENRRGCEASRNTL